MYLLTPKPYKQNGIALIIVLLFFQIISLLSLYGLEIVLNEAKQTRFIQQKHKNLYLAEQILQAIEKSDPEIINCRIPITSTYILQNKPKEWWQTETCVGYYQSLQYHFVIELLDTDPCALIQNHFQPSTVNYWRITLLVLINDFRIMLQSTITTPVVDSTLVCFGQQHPVTYGRQMWRQITFD